MKIIININTETFLLCHEALSMAFALAAFDHQIQLTIGPNMLNLLVAEPSGKLSNMLASLSMYDISPAWLSATDYERFTSWQDQQSPSYEWFTQLAAMPDIIPKFDTTFDL